MRAFHLVAFSLAIGSDALVKFPSHRHRYETVGAPTRLSADAYSGSSKAATTSKTLSQEQRRQESRDAGHNPLLSLNLNLDALARARAPARAQELCQRIAALHREGYYAVSPDIVSFNSVLKAWQTDPEKALEFWEAEAVPGRMNVRSYNTFLLSLAKAGMYEQAESLLRQMQVINAAVRPDRISWNTVLLAFATAACEHDPDAAGKADAMLRIMLGGRDSIDDNPIEVNDNEPDFMSLPPTIDPNYIPPQPDATSFNTVIFAWAAHVNAKKAAQQTEYWLRAMAQCPADCGNSFVRPDVYTYTTVIKAWSRCDGPVAAERALALLEEMQRGTELSTQPNRVTYTVVMQALCQNLQPDKAGRILQHMLERSDIRPDVVAFSVVVDGWAAYAKARVAVKDDVACRKAVFSVQLLLEQMKALSQQWPDMAPNERTYTSVLKTFAASQLFDAGILARQILAEMWDSKKTPPGTIHYNAALDCCAKVPRATKAVDAANLWQEMKDAAVQCDAITYNSVICAAANSFGSTELKHTSFEIGQQAFDALQADESCEPTSLTYNYYFKMVRRLLLKSTAIRRTAVKTTFDLCCAQGCLNEIILRQLLESSTNEELKVLLGDQHLSGTLTLSMLPTEWSRNALGIRTRRHGPR